MKYRLLLVLVVFMSMFGAWSIGGDIVDWWRGQLSPWFLARLLAAGITAVIFAISVRRDKSDEASKPKG